jgi:PIN domain nuclease of toxin-antitoxin system
MNYLLDSHTFLWWDSRSHLLSYKAKQVCDDPSNTLFVSIASVWEIQIKAQLGKLTLALPLADMIQTQVSQNNLLILPLQLVHVYALASLPGHHRDPFDRLIIAQAIHENLTLITSDVQIAQYPVATLW